jgi:hypothetical protein
MTRFERTILFLMFGLILGQMLVQVIKAIMVILALK